ncbi:hypothetical protein EVAR_69214_1 [Eumeta japonica]|uniref:Uncharacterized protein n=1 Tax=Eumeta variegata TaxID=151549 RepID=A0A4C2AGQ8_EUMVA|nr:hypothetical protein EVAR_69214_1 [Eumeta japonica]
MSGRVVAVKLRHDAYLSASSHLFGMPGLWKARGQVGLLRCNSMTFCLRGIEAWESLAFGMAAKSLDEGMPINCLVGLLSRDLLEGHISNTRFGVPGDSMVESPPYIHMRRQFYEVTGRMTISKFKSECLRADFGSLALSTTPLLWNERSADGANH